jgi:hypothetical protein
MDHLEQENWLHYNGTFSEKAIWLLTPIDVRLLDITMVSKAK